MGPFIIIIKLVNLHMYKYQHVSKKNPNKPHCSKQTTKKKKKSPKFWYSLRPTSRFQPSLLIVASLSLCNDTFFKFCFASFSYVRFISLSFALV